jgi:hypothetical protein
MWAKLEALSQGAKIASKQLWTAKKTAKIGAKRRKRA